MQGSWQSCTDNALADYRPADYRRQIIGQLSAFYRLFISGRIFVQQKSYCNDCEVTMVRKQWDRVHGTIFEIE